MRQKSGTARPTAESLVKDIRRRTRKHHSAEEKIRIVLNGLRGEDSIAELCRRKGIATSLYYSWSKEFLEAGKKRLAGDTAREATSPEVKELRHEASALKEAVADLTLENRLLKKACSGMGETRHEISRFREARDHPAGGAVTPAGEADPRHDRRAAHELLPLV
jgi:transposase